MNFSIKLSSILIALTLFCLYTESAKQLPCNDDTANEVDRLLAKVNPIGNNNMVFPQTIPEAKKYCKTLQQPFSTLEDLQKRCMKGMMKEVVGIVLYSLKKRRKTMCRKSPSQDLRDLVDSGKCVNSARSEIEKCANKSIDRFLAMESVKDEMKIPLACCEIAMAKRCILNSMDKVSVCTNKHEETLVGNFNSLSGGALKIACNEFQENSERCKQLKSFKLEVKGNRRRSSSIVMPVIRLFESIDKQKN